MPNPTLTRPENVVVPMPGVPWNVAAARAGLTPAIVVERWGLLYPLAEAAMILLTRPADMMALKRANGFLWLAGERLAGGEAVGVWLTLGTERLARAEPETEAVVRVFNLPDTAGAVLTEMRTAARCSVIGAFGDARDCIERARARLGDMATEHPG